MRMKSLQQLFLSGNLNFQQKFDFFSLKEILFRGSREFKKAQFRKGNPTYDVPIHRVNIYDIFSPNKRNTLPKV